MVGVDRTLELEAAGPLPQPEAWGLPRAGVVLLLPWATVAM